MTRSRIVAILASFTLGCLPLSAYAGSLTVSPVSLEVAAPGATSALTLSNAGAEPINAQIRVYRWTQPDGVDQLLPTTDVVASPPALKLNGGQQNVVRVVRLLKTPVTGEQAYRLVVDELPKAPKGSSVGVGISLRYSVPVFFTMSNAASDVSWTIAASGGNLQLIAHNSGTRRIRLADLKIQAGGKTIVVGQGLAGYVLSNSEKLWTVKASAKLATLQSTISVTAEGDSGHVQATAKVVPAK